MFDTETNGGLALICGDVANVATWGKAWDLSLLRFTVAKTAGCYTVISPPDKT